MCSHYYVFLKGVHVSSHEGENTNRFEIVYKETTVLATEGGQAQVSWFTGMVIILWVRRAGRLYIGAQKLTAGMYVVKAYLQGGDIVTKKIRK